MNKSLSKLGCLWGILIGLCYYLCQPYVTLAHVELVSSIPLPGAQLQAAPERIVLTFNEPVSAGSTFVVYDQDFGLIPAEVETDVTQPNVIVGRQIEIKESGVYTVQWVTISSDGHPIDGAFSFAVELDSETNSKNTEESKMELIAAAENTAVNLPGWFAWIMVCLAIIVPILVRTLTKKN